MDVMVIVIATAALFAWGLLSNELERADLIAPVAFIVVGVLLAGLDLIHGPAGPEVLTPLFELTLMWVLFSVAARLPVQEWRQDGGRNLRMLPVALAWIGAGMDRTTVLFVGWFGPRSLASLVFALLALEALGTQADQAVAVLTTTVLLSVVAHGLTAAPLARRYCETEAAAGPEPHGPVTVTSLRIH